jgi:hypothetical protein
MYFGLLYGHIQHDHILEKKKKPKCEVRGKRNEINTQADVSLTS